MAETTGWGMGLIGRSSDRPALRGLRFILKPNQKATQVAQLLGVTPPNELNAKQKAAYDKLSKLSGATFDRAFAKEMVADHKKDIKEFEKEAKNKDPAGQFAQQH